MSQAEALLNSLSTGDAVTYSASGSEGHIVVNADKTITVPEELKDIIVQAEHNVETVTFDCPRWWDEHDLSRMVVYINYKLPNGTLGAYLAKNVVADGDIMHFNWTIERNVTKAKGNIAFLVCIKKTDSDGEETNHWNSKICKDMFVSEGFEANEAYLNDNPDMLTQLLLGIDTLEANREAAETARAEAQAAKTAAETAKAEAKASAEEALYYRNQVTAIANAIEGEAEGEAVKMLDVSPVLHSVGVKARSKNLLPYPYINAITTINGITFTSNGDGSIIANGTATGAALFWVQNLQLKEGVPYVLSSGVNSPLNTCSIRSLDAVSVFATTSTTPVQFIPQKTDIYLVCARINPGETVNNLTFYPQLEEGSTATEWTPYVDVLNAQSENLLVYPYTETTKTANGITFTDNKDGSITVNGTATGQSIMKLCGNELALSNGTYFLSGCPSDASQTKGKFSLGLKENGSVNYIGVTSAGYLFTISDTVKFEALYIEVLENSVVNNLRVYPMINVGPVARPFVKGYASSPNLLPYPYNASSATVAGGSFVAQSDGGIAISGTPTGWSGIQLYVGKPLSKGFVSLSLHGTFTGAAFDVTLRSNGEVLRNLSPTTPMSINFANYPTCDEFLVGIKRAANGVEMSGTVYPMINAGSTALPYQKYVGLTPVKVTSTGKNLLPFPYYDKRSEYNGINITYREDGSILLNGTSTAATRLALLAYPIMVHGKYTLSGMENNKSSTIYIQPYINSHHQDVITTAPKTFEWDGMLTHLNLYWPAGEVINNLVVKPQIEVGEVATEFECNVASTGIGENLIPWTHGDNATTVSNGVTFTFRSDKTILANGTASDRAICMICSGTKEEPLVEPGLYILSGAPSGAGVDRRIQFWDYNAQDVGNGALVNFTNSGDTHNIAISISEGFTCDNMIFRPELRKSMCEPRALESATEPTNFDSIAPSMTLYSDNRNVVLECDYNKDINKVLKKITDAINTLGGSVTI